MSFLLDQLCVFCAQIHNPLDCTVYPTADVRQTRLNELKRCYRCLKTGHISPRCRDFVGCVNCNGATHHHTALCDQTMRIRGNAVSEAEKCVFCDKHYESTTCRTFSNATCRRRIVQKKKLCYLCLKQHVASECPEEVKPCDYCGESTHHNAICRHNPFLKKNTANNTFSGACMFCGSSHKGSMCKLVTDLETRKQILAAQGRCNSCLQVYATNMCFFRYRCRICQSSEHHRVICPQNPLLRSATSSPVSLTSPYAPPSWSSPSSSRNSRHTPEPLFETPPTANTSPILSPTPSDSSSSVNGSSPSTKSFPYIQAREAFYSSPPSKTTVKPIGFERQFKTIKSCVSSVQCNDASWDNLDRMQAFEKTIEQRFYKLLLEDY